MPNITHSVITVSLVSFKVWDLKTEAICYQSFVLSGMVSLILPWHVKATRFVQHSKNTNIIVIC